jgi:hypothetical protein
VNVAAFAEAIAERLQRGVLPQYGFLVLAGLAVSLAVLWPSSGEAHELWYRFAPLRSSAVALFVIGFGMGLPRLNWRERGVESLAVALVVAMTLPLESLAYLRSLPALPEAWLWWSTPLVIAGQLALGAYLGLALRRLGLLVIAPIAVPLVVSSLVVLDLQLGVSLLNPWTAPLVSSWTYPAVHALLAVLAVAHGRLHQVGVNGAA